MAEGGPLVLIADDEPATVKYLRVNLEARGYRVTTASDGIEALRKFRRQAINIALLDITMPGLDGFEVCRQIRNTTEIPVIMLTAHGTEADIVKAFDCGADDYITKPFGLQELLARVNAAYRRASGRSGPSPEPVKFGSLVFDFSARRVWDDGREVELTGTEYSLLSLLARNANKVLTHRFILESIWGGSYSSEKEYVRAYIYRLRTKLDQSGEKDQAIISVPGVGYMFRDPVTDDSFRDVVSTSG